MYRCKWFNTLRFDLLYLNAVFNCYLHYKTVLLYAAVGSVNPHASGVISTLNNLAATLEPNSSRAPVITIESDKRCAIFLFN